MNANDPILTAYALGEITDPAELARVEAALAAHPELRDVVDSIRSTADDVSAALSREPVPVRRRRETTSTERLSPAARRGRIARFKRDAPTLERKGKGSYGAFAAAMVACVTLLGLTLFKHLADHFEEREESRSNLVEVDSLNPEDLELRSELAEEIAAQVAAERAEEAAKRESVLTEIAALEITPDEPRLRTRDPLPPMTAPGAVAVDLGESPGRGLPSSELDFLRGLEIAGGDQEEPAITGLPPAPAEEAATVVARSDDRLSGASRTNAVAAVTLEAPRTRMVAYEDFAHSVDRFQAAAQAELWQESYDSIREEGFVSPRMEPLSTFSIDVDTASYSNVRRLLNEGRRPPSGAVRIEELVNYFSYDYPAPETRDPPFSVALEVAEAPWEAAHRLVRVALKGYELPWSERPPSNLVFLIDVSGSMEAATKLPLVQQSLRKLVERLDARDRVAIVTYAGSERVALPSTTANNHETILHAIEQLGAGGSTAGGAGVQRAYELARQHFDPDGNNRVILCTDGDFNVGLTNRSDLVELIEEEAGSGVFLSVFGFGMGNYQDAMLEELSNRGNGNYAYIDSEREAEKVFVEGAAGTLMTIAEDVKIQVEFNPSHVQAYRLIGYENRSLAAQEFADDAKDAGEMGAGHDVTALYEIIPDGVEWEQPSADNLRYQRLERAAPGSGGEEELLTVKLRYKLPSVDSSKELQRSLRAEEAIPSWRQASDDFRWAAAVAGFGMILRDSEHRGATDWQLVERLARSAVGSDPEGARREFLELIALARRQLDGKVRG